MFTVRRKRRELKRKFDLARERDHARFLKHFGLENRPERSPVKDQIDPEDRNALDCFDSDILTEKAARLGIELPPKSLESDWWACTIFDNDFDIDPEDRRSRPYWLSEIGRSRTKKLIREEQRATIEWWVKVITPLIGALISLLGLLVALVSVSRK